MKKNIQSFVIEIITIILGILIALYINNWNEDRKEQKYLSKIYSSIDKELTESSEDILYKIAKQKSFVDSLDFYLEDNTISLLDITIKAEGIDIPTIKMNSWKAVSSSKIELVDYDKLSALANIEEQKGILRMKSRKLADFLYSNSAETGKDKKGFMKLMMLDIINTEIPLQKDIQKVMSKKQSKK